MNGEPEHGVKGETLLIVTGASRGIGRSLAKLFLARNEGTLIGISRSRPIDLPAVGSSGTEPESDRYLHVTADLGDPEEAADRLNTIFAGRADTERYSRFFLVNNAGMIGPVKPVGQAESRTLVANMMVNAAAPLVLMNLFLRYFGSLDADRRIINISSGAARHAYPGWAAYCSSKAALDMASLALATEQESARNPVRILSLAPGVVDTAMQDEIRLSDESDFPPLSRFLAMKDDGLLADPDVPAHRILELLFSGDFPQKVLADVRDTD